MNKQNWKTYEQMMKPLTIAIGLILIAAFLAGCSSPMKDVPTPVTLPERFSTSGTAELPDQWWRALGDEHLNEYMETALTNNFDLLSAWDRLAQAEAIARREGAELLPSVDAGGAFSRTREYQGQATSLVPGSSPGSRTTYYNRYQLGVTVSYELDLWGRIRAQQRGAVLDAQASEFDVAATAITLSARVARTWYQLVESRAQVEVIERQIETNEQTLTLITTQFQQGLASAADVLRQRQLIESTRGQAIQAREQLALLQSQLAVLLGQAPTDLAIPDRSKLIDLPPLAAVPIPAELIQRRPDVRSAYATVQAADQRLAVAIANQYPRLSLSAGVETSGTKARDLFDNWLANIAANATQPLFDGDLRRAEVDRNRAVVSQSIRAYGQTVLNALQEVEDALMQEQRQAEYLGSLKEQLYLAQQVLERTRNSYSKGQLGYLRVLDALTSLQQIERSYLATQRQLIVRRIDLCQALAGGWTMSKPEPAILAQQ